MKWKVLALAAILSFSSSLAIAAQTVCQQQYLGGQAPALLNQKLAPRTVELCYLGYGDLYSGTTRTPLAVGEHLTRERLSGPHPERHNAFHPDPNLSPAERAELEDYAHSGFDRGHQAPSGDMPDERSQYESFSLANMIPQNPNNNRNLWEGIESATRDLAKRDGQLYVVTGPIFYGSNLQRIDKRVLVPTYIYKAVYDPKRKEAAAYLVKNEPGMHYAVISISELERLSGIDPFPALPESIKEKTMSLPEPRAHSRQPGVEDQSIVPRT